MKINLGKEIQQEDIVKEKKLSVTRVFSDGNLRDRFRMLFIKMLSLKFLAFIVQVILGIIWFSYLLEEIANPAVWGIWSGYMVGAFTVYTAGNVTTKKFPAPFKITLPDTGGEE